MFCGPHVFEDQANCLNPYEREQRSGIASSRILLTQMVAAPATASTGAAIYLMTRGQEMKIGELMALFGCFCVRGRGREKHYHRNGISKGK